MRVPGRQEGRAGSVERGQGRGQGRVRAQDRTQDRPVRAVGLLLLLEVGGLVLLALYELSRVDWRGIEAWNTPPPGALGALAVVLFAPAALLAFLAALSFLLLRGRGWLLAAASQGLGLAVCLALYTETERYYVYPIMAYCVLVILYLNSQTVRTAFRDARSPKNPAGDGPP